MIATPTGSGKLCGDIRQQDCDPYGVGKIVRGHPATRLRPLRGRGNCTGTSGYMIATPTGSGKLCGDIRQHDCDPYGVGEIVRGHPAT